MEELDRTARFVQALTQSQARLYAYILTLLPDHDAANDVLQNANMVMWKKSEQFNIDTSFSAWSSSIAYYEVLAYRKRKAHDRHLFSESLLQVLSETAVEMAGQTHDRAIGLQSCLDKLSETQLNLIRKRYESSCSVAKIARELKKTEGAVSQALYRIRQQLAMCIERHSTKLQQT